MQNATFVNLEWIKSEGPQLMQGIKKHRKPSNALYGGNGSFVVAGESAKLYLTVVDDDGKKYRQQVYGRVMQATNRQRMSEKLFYKVYSQFENATFSVDSVGNISWTCKLG